MQDLELGELFGSNSSQDTVNLIIKKADLIDLIPSSVNRAEEIFVAILLTAIKHFKGEIVTESDEILTDENGNYLIFDNSDDYLMNAIFWRKRFIASNDANYIQYQLVITDNQLYEED